MIVWITNFFLCLACSYSLSLQYFCQTFYGTCCEVGNAYLIKTGSVFQLLWQHLHCMVELTLNKFLYCFLVVVVFCLLFCWYQIPCLYPAFVSASLCDKIEFLNISLPASDCDNLNSIDFCSILIIDGRWLDYVLT